MDVFARVLRNLKVDHLPIVAAGVAFYAFLAFVPALAAIIALYAFIAEPAQAQEHVRTLGKVLPADGLALLERQVGRMTSNNRGAGWSAIIAIVFALWGSARGVKGLMQGLNVAYHEREDRNFFVLNGVALLLTFGAMVTSILLLALVAVLPGVLGFVGLGGFSAVLVQIARWGLLVLLFLALLGAVYRYGPSRAKAQWRWLSPGAVLSTALWLLGSIGFSIYVRSFGDFDATYGALGAVVVLMLWLFLSAFAILLGAEVNSELERQTRQDSTTSPDQPMGSRGAYSADTLGKTREE
jgi:membrane protein